MFLYSVEVARPGRSINTGTQKSPLVRQHERAWCGKAESVAGAYFWFATGSL
jgi:hypothetical protein